MFLILDCNKCCSVDSSQRLLLIHSTHHVTSIVCSTFSPGVSIPCMLDFFSHAWLPFSCSPELMPACRPRLIHCVHFLRIFPHYVPSFVSLSILPPARDPPFLQCALHRSRAGTIRAQDRADRERARARARELLAGDPAIPHYCIFCIGQSW